MRKLFGLGGATLFALSAVACMSTGGSTTGGFGGAAGTPGFGGSVASGGAPSLGGAPSGGGAPSFGGSVASGGAPSFGGAPSGGGAPSFGGTGGTAFGGTGGVPSGGSAGFDLSNCTGPASSTGSLPDGTPNATVGFVQPDPSGNLKVILAPKANTTQGDVIIGVYFFPTPGQLSYPPNGSVGCAVFRDDGSSYTVLDKTTLCDLELTGLVLASSPGVCDGAISGSFTALFTGNTPIGGTFTLPVNVAESQTSHPSCQPPDGPCSVDSDCCDQSCSKYIGVCN